MRNLSFYAVVATSLLLLSSCARELDNEDVYIRSSQVERSFTGTYSDTKTTINIFTNAVTWKQGDVIAIVGSKTSTTASAENLSNSNTRATFTASVNDQDQLYAVYPSSVYGSLKDNTLTVTVPNSQNGTFASANIAISKEDSGIFNFNNATSVLRFCVQNTPGAAKVIIEGYSNSGLRPIAGSVSYDMTMTDCPVSSVGSPYSYSSVTATLINGYTYVSIIPQLYQSLKFYIKDSSSKTLRTVTYDTSIDCRPGQLYTFDDLSSHIDTYPFMDWERFSLCNGQGGSTDFTSEGPAIAAGNEDAKTDQSGWSFVNCYEGDGCIAIGGPSCKGSATTPALNIETGKATLYFDCARTKTSSQYVGISIVGSGYISQERLYLISSSSWMSSNTFYITGADKNTRVRFYALEDSDIIYLDNVRVIDGAPDFGYINIPQTEWEIPAYQTYLEVPVYSNRSLVSSYSVKYIQRVQTVSSANLMKVWFNANETKNPVSATVDIRPDGLDTRTIKFVQKGKVKVEAAAQSLTFKADGESISDKLTIWNFGADLQVTATSSNVQFKLGNPVMNSDSVLTVTASKNTSREPVTGNIVIKAEDSQETRYDTVAVYQKGAKAVDFLPEETVFADSLANTVTCAGDTLGVKIVPVNFDGDLDITATSSDEDVFTVVKVGVDSVTLFIPKNTEYTKKSAKLNITIADAAGGFSKAYEYTVNVAGDPSAKKPQELSFKVGSETITSVTGYYGDTFTAPTLEGAKTDVTYSIVCNPETPACATIDPSTGEVTLNQVNGTATITATAAEGIVEEVPYLSAAASYTLTVKRLPQAYTEQSSLVSDGTKHIETEYTPNQDTRVVVDYKYAVSKSGGYLFGSFEQDYAGDYKAIKEYVVNMGTAGVYVKYGSNRNTYSKTSSVCSTNRQVLEINGGVITFTTQGGEPDVQDAAAKGDEFTCPLPMYIFYSSRPSTGVGSTQSVSGFKGTLYSFKIYDGAAADPTHDFVPAKSASGTDEGLWDLVSKTFYSLVDNVTD